MRGLASRKTQSAPGCARPGRQSLVVSATKKPRELKKVKRKRKDVPNEVRLRAMSDPERMWQLRMKFLEQAKKYFGVPYARKYWKPQDAEYNSRLFLDCCGLVRRVMRDLKRDFGFVIGPWNQAYMCDTLPITLDREEDMKPGDLVFISATYYDSKMKKQKHSMTHVEIWLGEDQKTIGARWHKGKVQIFDSYKFESTSYHSMKYIFKSIDTWLMGICRSHCPEHPWKTRAQRFTPSKKSVFSMLIEQNNADSDESAGDCSGEETVPSGEIPEKECVKKSKPAARVKKVKKVRRSSKSAQPRLTGTSEAPKMSEMVKLPLSADNKRLLIKSRAQQHQLVLQSLGVQGKAFGQQRARVCQNFVSSATKSAVGNDYSQSTREDFSAKSSQRGNVTETTMSSSDQSNTDAAVPDQCAVSILSSVAQLTLTETAGQDIVPPTSAQHRCSKPDKVQLFTVQAEMPTKAKLLPPINQPDRWLSVTEFGCPSSLKTAPSGNPASAFSISSGHDAGDDFKTSSPSDLVDISEDDHVDEEQSSEIPGKGSSPKLVSSFGDVA